MSIDIILTDEQKRARDYILACRRRLQLGGFVSLTGPAGTGKSTLLRELDEEFELFTAMTGKAALRLAECVGRGTSTLHRVLYYKPEGYGRELKFSKIRLPEIRSVAVDESSMMTPAVFNDLHVWKNRCVCVLLVGDPFQLPPVISEKNEIEKYGEDYSVFSLVKGAELKTVMRNAGAVLRTVTKIRETQQVVRENDFDEVPNGSSYGAGYEFVTCSDPMRRAVDDWLEDPDDHVLITWRNAMRMSVNNIIRNELGHSGPLADPGEPILIRKNGQGFLNGEVVECQGWQTGPVIGERKDRDGKVTVSGLQTMWLTAYDISILVTVQGSGEDPDDAGWFDGSSPWISNWKAYHADLKMMNLPDPLPVTWGYVNTGHSSQGSEWRRATVFLDEFDLRSNNFNKMTKLPDGTQATFSARFLYTALSRAKTRSTLVIGQ